MPTSIPSIAVALRAVLLTAAGLSIAVAMPAEAAGATTAFRYQGRLAEAGRPANGAYDFHFNLFPAAAGGTALSTPLTNAAAAVADGLFTLQLDFGTEVFGGGARWLEIAVRPAGQSGAFTTLLPRQPLTPVPYSIHTLKAESLTGPLPISLLPANVARLDADALRFSGAVTFGSNANILGTLEAGAISGNGAGLSNVSAAAISARLAQRLWRVPIPLVTVTNAGNPPDVSGKGAVPYNYRIGKFEVNNHQYVAFLNAVASADPNALYKTNMTADVHGGILRSGQPGDYVYSVKTDMGHRPVVWVEFPDTLRFCNWLHNGQPTGPQDATTTEDGAYTMRSETVWGNTILRNPGARYWIPSDDEWYKAAYHQPAADGGDADGYWDYPTRSNDAPYSEEPPGFNNSVNACCNTGRKSTDVGAYWEASSYYGTFDQGGNVEEWTEEILFITNRRLRGGSWLYNEYYSKSTDLEFDTPDYEADGIGFRVAGMAE